MIGKRENVTALYWPRPFGLEWRVSDFFTPLPVRPLACSPPASFTPWLVRPLARSPLGWFAPVSFAPWLVRPVPGWFDPWLVCPLARSPPGLFAPYLIRPLTCSPPLPVEYTCDSLLRLVFVFQFTERQLVSNKQMTVDNHSNSSTVT